MSAVPVNKEDLLDTALHGIYIPTALLIFGVALVKPYWTPYAILVAGSLALLKFYRGSKYISYFQVCVVILTYQDPNKSSSLTSTPSSL